MSEYNEGDLVEAVKTEVASSTRFRGVLALVENANHVKGLVLKAQGYEPMMQWLEDRGFEFTVIERAKPALPTEVGAYVDKYGHDVWTITRHHELMCVANSSSNPEKYAPFTRLEPVAETAKKVLDMVRDRALVGTTDSMTIRYLVLDNIATEFGVTGELGE